MSGISIPINLVSALMLTTMTGSLALVIWYFAGRVLVRFGYLRWYYSGLKVVICLFILPVSYLIIIWINCYHFMWHGRLFVRTSVIMNVCQVICDVWITGMFFVGVKYLYEAYRLARRNRKIVSCTGLEYRIFAEVCKGLRIPEGKVGLFQSNCMMTVEFMGLIHPKVIIPERSYNENDKEMLKAVFLHELVHYKQRDIFWKQMVMLVTVLQYFNPMVWILNRLMGKWSEYACDAQVCGLTENPVRYFNNILRMAENICAGKMYSATIQLAKNKSDLLERVAYMFKISKYTKKPVCAAVITSLLLMATCSVSVAAASNEAAKKYVDWYDITDVATADDSQEEPEFVEFMDNGPDSGVSVTVEDEQKSRAIQPFSWVVHANGLRLSRNIYVFSGRKISINVYQYTHTDKNIKVGIVRPDGKRVYVIGNTQIFHEFSATMDGFYQVFIENNNSVDITVEGTYNAY